MDGGGYDARRGSSSSWNGRRLLDRGLMRGAELTSNESSFWFKNPCIVCGSVLSQSRVKTESSLSGVFFQSHKQCQWFFPTTTEPNDSTRTPRASIATTPPIQRLPSSRATSPAACVRSAPPPAGLFCAGVSSLLRRLPTCFQLALPTFIDANTHSAAVENTRTRLRFLGQVASPLATQSPANRQQHEAGFLEPGFWKREP